MICWTLSPSQPMLHCGCGICSSMTFSCWRRVVLTRLVSESAKVHIMLINWIINDQRVYKFEWTLCSSSFPCRRIKSIYACVHYINHSHAFKFGHVLYFLLEYSLYHSLSWGMAPLWSTKCRQFAFDKNGNASSTKGKYLHWVINLSKSSIENSVFHKPEWSARFGRISMDFLCFLEVSFATKTRPSASLRTASPPVEGDGFRWPWKCSASMNGIWVNQKKMWTRWWLNQPINWWLKSCQLRWKGGICVYPLL